VLFRSRTMEHFPRQANRRVGVVGLGTGSMAAWSKAGDYFRIYEINDTVERLARNRFTYLSDSPAQVEVVMGDARLSMEREPDQRFDILVLDAFSSDAIPVHLLTQEAFEIYRRHLQPDGVIAVHISNRYLELQPIVLEIAAFFGFRTAIISNADTEWSEEEVTGIPSYGSDWVLVTKNEAFLKLPAISGAASKPGEYSPKIKMWTDEESNLFQILALGDDSWLAWLRRQAL
jgi:spermidine synthase